MVECVHHAIEKSLNLRRMYDRTCLKHGKSTATISVARKMLKIVFHMLKENEPFHDYPVMEGESGYRHGVMTH